MLRRGFDLPPLMFTADEIDAIAVGARLVPRLRDPGLQTRRKQRAGQGDDRAAGGVAKGASSKRLSSSRTGMPRRRGVSTFRVCGAPYARPASSGSPMPIPGGRESEWTVWPVAMAYYVDVTVLGAWCEMRGDFRHFRVERIPASAMLDERFPTEGGKLMERWFALQEQAKTNKRL